MLGIVGSSQPSALFVELGTRPHMPPVAAIEPWVRAVLGIREPRTSSAWRSWSRERSPRRAPPRSAPWRAAQATEGQIVAMFERAADQVAKYLEGAAS